MELSLRKLLDYKSLSFLEVVALASGIAKGMTALHERGYMHHDLSSNNVLLDSRSNPKIADFGLSRVLNSYGGISTILYLPPQMHTRHYGIKGDVWEFAVLLSEIMRGLPPDSRLGGTAEITQFLSVQRTLLSAPNICELDRLFKELSDITVAQCLSRRTCIIDALHNEPKFTHVHPACVGLFSFVVESSLSIIEDNWPPFSTIEKELMTCAQLVFSRASLGADEDKVTAGISECLSVIASTFSSHNATPAPHPQRL
ncbi:hypothetical protein Pelo_4986 [Pelomyxa schiedti]|nr:hypothetical protein Pelo_4986 [Pelomyxa schiedti]